ncbi:MAG: hypothetical protein ABIU96_04820 [Rhodanobacter sp.]
MAMVAELRVRCHPPQVTPHEATAISAAASTLRSRASVRPWLFGGGQLGGGGRKEKTALREALWRALPC